jgi:Lon protease-like protein
VPPALVVPIFPLPDVTLFPKALLPLHIFEARYRAMISDALARDRRICMVRLRPGYDEAAYAGKPEVYGVGGLGEIVSCERLATGRYDLVLRGEARVRIVSEQPSDTLYRLVSAARIEDVAPAADVTPIVERIRDACRTLLTVLGRPVDFLDAAFADTQAPGAIADRIAAGVLPGADVRQELLETAEIDLRLGRLALALDALVEQLRRNKSS